MGLLAGYERRPQDEANGYRRGDIYYIRNNGERVGSEMKKDRPGIIVSNDANNKYSQVVEVVYLTTQPKHELPTHVTIRSTGRVSMALCEQPTPIAIERIGQFVAKATDTEMKNVDVALEIGLGIRMDKQQQEYMEKLLTGAGEKPAGGASQMEKGKHVEQAQAASEAEKKELNMLRVEADNLHEEVKRREAEKHRIEGERDAYRQMYEKLLSQMITAGKKGDSNE